MTETCEAKIHNVLDTILITMHAPGTLMSYLCKFKELSLTGFE